jgi:hypothetical protein
MAKGDEKRCEELKKEIKNMMAECQSCKTDEECFLDEKLSGSCPFGCHYLRSHIYDDSESIALIKKKIEQYNNECGGCLYDCALPPKDHEVGCKKGRCVDLRYYSEKD